MDINIFEQFVWFIRERESIRKKKESGSPPPWTDDPFLQKYKFTNVWRQDDKTTKYIHSVKRDNWLDEILWIAWARIINKIETLQELPAPTFLTLDEWSEEIINHSILYSDAYIVLPRLPKGSIKIHEIIRLLKIIAHNCEVYVDLTLNTDTPSEEEIKLFIFRNLPRIKGLILYEMMCDWRQYSGEEETYCNIGTGASSTLKLLYPNEKPSVEQIAEITDILNAEGSVKHETYGYLTWRCIEGVCCEFRKYLNLKNRNNSRKRKYKYV